MKTIKELEAMTLDNPRYIEDLERLQALKDVLGLIDESKSDDGSVLIDAEELKARITG